MRINCEVTVASRQLANNNQRQPRPARASFGIGRRGKETCLHLCTALNREGTHYKIAGNLEGVFTKFASEGKFTVRIKEPMVDLIVKSDPLQVKAFLQTLKACVTNKDVDKLKLSVMAPVKASQLSKPKTTLTINSKEEYPITTGFPYSLEHLTVSGCSLSRVERRMLHLARLKTLNLGHNLISDLPPGLAEMALTVLALPGNRLDRLHPDVFNGTIRKTLARLDLSNNEMEYLPSSWCLLQQLVHVNLSNNKIKRLPLTLFHLLPLRHLLVSGNRLDSLPAGLLRLRLHELDVSGNPFGLQTPGEQISDLPPVLSLVELAARSVLNHSSRDSSFPSLPVTLQRRLRTPFLCTSCPSPAVLEASVATMGFTYDWLRTMCPTILLHLDRSAPTPLLLRLTCSHRCARRP